nr:MAG TPA: hypothetical protein [Caudoviricetes sp.]
MYPSKSSVIKWLACHCFPSLLYYKDTKNIRAIQI